MKGAHRTDENVRAYLLGVLDEREASELEANYFSDPEALRRIREIEDSLIEDYLADRLSRHERRQFEARYLTIPDLRKRLDEIGNRRGAVPAKSESPVWFPLRHAFALVALGAVASGVVAIGIAYHSRARSPRNATPSEVVSIGSRIAAVDILLTPGVAKGAGAKSTEFASPVVNTPIRLKLDLPGKATPADYMVRIFAVDAQGHRNPVWSSATVRSTSLGFDGRLSVELDSSILPPNDYVAEVAGINHLVEDSYLFRVMRPALGR